MFNLVAMGNNSLVRYKIVIKRDLGGTAHLHNLLPVIFTVLVAGKGIIWNAWISPSLLKEDK